MDAPHHSTAYPRMCRHDCRSCPAGRQPIRRRSHRGTRRRASAHLVPRHLPDPTAVHGPIHCRGDRCADHPKIRLGNPSASPGPTRCTVSSPDHRVTHPSDDHHDCHLRRHRRDHPHSGRQTDPSRRAGGIRPVPRCRARLAGLSAEEHPRHGPGGATPVTGGSGRRTADVLPQCPRRSVQGESRRQRHGEDCSPVNPHGHRVGRRKKQVRMFRRWGTDQSLVNSQGWTACQPWNPRSGVPAERILPDDRRLDCPLHGTLHRVQRCAPAQSWQRGPLIRCRWVPPADLYFAVGLAYLWNHEATLPYSSGG